MAHKSKKKHIKHLHQHERDAPASATKARSRPKAAAKAPAGNKRGGLVRRIAKAAGKKLAAKPKGIVSRAKARVRSLLGNTVK